jgi:arabinose-5-phosphate isomerase
VWHFAQMLQRLGVPIITMAGRQDSTLARAAEVFLDISVEREADPLGLAPTASTATTMAVGDALAAGLMVLSGFTAEDFALRHPGGSLGSYLSEVGQ